MGLQAMDSAQQLQKVSATTVVTLKKVRLWKKNAANRNVPVAQNVRRHWCKQKSKNMRNRKIAAISPISADANRNSQQMNATLALKCSNQEITRITIFASGNQSTAPTTKNIPIATPAVRARR